MASFRGQEIFPMMSGDVPRHTRKVLRKKSEIFFLRFQLWLENSETPPDAKHYFPHTYHAQYPKAVDWRPPDKSPFVSLFLSTLLLKQF